MRRGQGPMSPVSSPRPGRRRQTAVQAKIHTRTKVWKSLDESDSKCGMHPACEVHRAGAENTPWE